LPITISLTAKDQAQRVEEAKGQISEKIKNNERKRKK
jgi:hypothetical protein